MNILDYPIFILLIIVGMFWLYFISKDSKERKLNFRRRYKNIKYNSHINKSLLLLFAGNPALVIISTFFILGLIGALLLMTPFATYDGINLSDAVFTAVSASCVTGLITLDTPAVFTGYGQFIILLLIQLGGLGIMTIATVALAIVGYRFSLKEEILLKTLTETGHKDILTSLSLVLKTTIVIESIGAIILSLLFFDSGLEFKDAIWHGLFTSVSAFCNAGFSLQQDSLISFQSNPGVLYAVAALIILGGLAPATTFILPKWISGKKIDLIHWLPLVTTFVLIIACAFIVLIFEWDQSFEYLSLGDKFHNAIFQSVTLRTAGFNSVDFSKISNITYLTMLFAMFVGGSPGGTAGGIKTTTLAVLLMTFWANITGRSDVIVQNRKLGYETIYKAVTIVIAGLILIFFGVFILEVTQDISLKTIIFEVISAIATVGLSIGGTLQLDSLGKFILAFIMFSGRIGPITLFMLLNNNTQSSRTNHLEAKVLLS